MGGARAQQAIAAARAPGTAGRRRRAHARERRSSSRPAPLRAALTCWDLPLPPPPLATRYARATARPRASKVERWPGPPTAARTTPWACLRRVGARQGVRGSERTRARVRHVTPTRCVSPLCHGLLDRERGEARRSLDAQRHRGSTKARRLKTPSPPASLQAHGHRRRLTPFPTTPPLANGSTVHSHHYTLATHLEVAPAQRPAGQARPLTAPPPAGRAVRHAAGARSS